VLKHMVSLVKIASIGISSAIKNNGTSIMVAHNHPSGKVNSSTEDDAPAIRRAEEKKHLIPGGGIETAGLIAWSLSEK